MAVPVMHPERTRFDFGQLARDYERWYETPTGRAHDRVQKEDVSRLLRPARPGEKLLDVGCGTGHWSAFFVESGYEITGVDIAPEMIQAARTAVPLGSFQVADACELPFDDASFDVAASMATLEFVPDAEAAVREMARCTKPGGRLLVGTLNRLAPLNRHRLSKGKQPYASAHLFAPEELRSLLAPWGRARMAASSPRGRKSEPALVERLRHCLAAIRGRLRGPFIVAEVVL